MYAIVFLSLGEFKIVFTLLTEVITFDILIAIIEIKVLSLERFI